MVQIKFFLTEVVVSDCLSEGKGRTRVWRGQVRKKRKDGAIKILPDIWNTFRMVQFNKSGIWIGKSQRRYVVSLWPDNLCTHTSRNWQHRGSLCPGLSSFEKLSFSHLVRVKPEEWLQIWSLKWVIFSVRNKQTKEQQTYLVISLKCFIPRVRLHFFTYRISQVPGTIHLV